MWHQRLIRLRPRLRGFHLITRDVAEALPELAELRVGPAHVHILHTSASLTLNENASPDVRADFATARRETLGPLASSRKPEAKSIAADRPMDESSACCRIAFNCARLFDQRALPDLKTTAQSA